MRVLRDARISLALIPPLASVAMRVGARTLRRADYGRQHPEGCWKKGERIIVAFWHGRLLLMPFVYPGAPAAILISQHRDGEYITRIAERIGFAVERGSATRGGARAFRQLVQRLKSGWNVVITPDGPKGPSGRVKSGVIELSRLSSMPILPVAFSAWPRIQLASWDRFIIPYPFARGVYVWGPPLYVPPEVTKADAEGYQSELAARLDQVGAEADQRARGQWEGPAE